MIKVSIQGVAGSFHEIAARKYFKKNEIEIIQCNTFNDLFDTLEYKDSDFGVVAIENSVAGSIIPNYALLKDSDLKVIGEVYLRIEQHLVGLSGQKIEDIVEIHSHPMAIQQCQAFLNSFRRNGIRLIDSEDTALSAKIINEKNLKNIAAISSELAANMYNLEILAKGIETNNRNFTRFLVISDEVNYKCNAENSDINKATICFNLPHNVGSLSQVLSVQAFYNINLTKIQSLPIIGKEWEYLFYTDLVFTDYKKYRLSLDAIKPLTAELLILGEYKKALTSKK